MKKIAVIVLAMLLSLARNAMACEGNACDSVQFAWENNCHVAKNVGSRKVKVEWGSWTCNLKPGESCTITNPFGGGCVDWIVGPQKANYAD
jgi:hypothetical protein